MLFFSFILAEFSINATVSLTIFDAKNPYIIYKILFLKIKREIDISMNNFQYSSSKINALVEQIRIGNVNSLNLFWENVEREGSPLIESIKDDDNNALLTYIYKGDENTKNVVVMHPTCWKDYKNNMLINTKFS